jgi:hypothetical protein
MSPFEKAQIKLRAWEALNGWGTKMPDKEFSDVWNWDERLKWADKLTEWALIKTEESNVPTEEPAE